jgi:hypothetical protein
MRSGGFGDTGEFALETQSLQCRQGALGECCVSDKDTALRRTDKVGSTLDGSVVLAETDGRSRQTDTDPIVAVAKVDGTEVGDDTFQLTRLA